MTGDIEQLLRQVGDVTSRLKRLRMLRELGGNLTDQVQVWMDQTHQACHDAELVVAGAGGGPLASAAAQARNLPMVTAHLQPLGAPTTSYPGLYAPQVPRWLGGPGRYLSGIYTDLAITLPTRGAVRRARRTVLNLPPGPDRQAPATPTLYGYSRHVLPRPPSWDRQEPWRPDPRRGRRRRRHRPPDPNPEPVPRRLKHHRAIARRPRHDDAPWCGIGDDQPRRRSRQRR